jgi:CubicO group peptidase (beta-lactamase class C family)
VSARPLFALVALALLTAFGRGQQTLAARAAELVDAVRTERGIPGLGFAVRDAEGRIEAGGSGLADLEQQVAVTAATSFRLASISKPLTAVAALRLHERGDFPLDRPVAETVAAWPAKAWPVTPRLLLGHLGGVRHYRGDEIHSKVRYRSVTEALSIFAADPLEHEPGTRYRYTTYGYNLLGAAIEAAAGAPFVEVLQREVLGPAGCATLRVDDAAAIVPGRAAGYRRDGGRLANSEPVDTSNKIPGGGLCGTPTDLVRFAGALLDGRLLRAETLEQMWTSMRTGDGAPTGYGMGFSVGRDEERRVAFHGGAQPRVSTMLWIDRDARVAVALMANLEGEAGALRALAPRLAALARD